MTPIVSACAIAIVALLLVGFAGALLLVAAPMPAHRAPEDVFGFGELRGGLPVSEPPPLDRMFARDGVGLAYRLYAARPPAAAEVSGRLLIFTHGSSYHGGGYHALAESISGAGVADVLLPNLRGHLGSGRRRGDVDYIGQLEDDLVAWIDWAGDIAQMREMGSDVLVVVGEADEANGADATRALFAEHLPSATVVTPAGVDHFGVVREPNALAVVRDGLRARPLGAPDRPVDG